MRLIDADALKKKILTTTFTKNNMWALNLLIGLIDDIPTDDAWISVKDRMPENAKHPDAFCPRYLVYTDYGITEGWYNPNKECWYGVLMFMTDIYEEWNIDLEKGDIPKRVKNIPVKYWMPMSEPPKENL